MEVVQLEKGVTFSAISWQCERWASIAAMTQPCRNVTNAEQRSPIVTTHRKLPTRPTVQDPIDEASNTLNAAIRGDHR